MLSSIKPPKVNYHDNYLVKYPDVDIVTYRAVHLQKFHHWLIGHK